ncbi:MAG: hypothetical protein FWG87_02120 [Defluviitaleaceae bacterium]|nr:hypothetical protein [Defluviitaleaceae bacterium]
MKNYYSTIDNVTLTFSDIEAVNDFEFITTRFERASGNGFDYAEGKLPNNLFYKAFGFSEDELLEMQDYLQRNSCIIWELAREQKKAKTLHPLKGIIPLDFKFELDDIRRERIEKRGLNYL